MARTPSRHRAPRRLLGTLAVAGLAAVGCLYFPDEAPYIALDYRLERPRVLAIRIRPYLVSHGREVTVDALVMGPGQVERVSVDLCGLRDDVGVMVWDVNCFGNEELVTHLSDTLPFSWEPPDFSEVTCDSLWDTGRWDSGGWRAPRDEEDSGLVDSGVHPWWPCSSTVPLLVRADMDGERAYGEVYLDIRHQALEEGERLPRHVDSATRSLGWSGEAVPGGQIDLWFTLHTDWYDGDFAWYVDDGELLRTGRTVMHERTEDTVTTTNTLAIPERYEGPLRVVVVVNGWYYASGGGNGNMTWETIELEVAP